MYSVSPVPRSPCVRLQLTYASLPRPSRPHLELEGCFRGISVFPTFLFSL